MRSARLQELQEMVDTLAATVRELPPGQDHHNALREIEKYQARVTALDTFEPKRVYRGPRAKK
jgi:hypothetical protein